MTIWFLKKINWNKYQSKVSKERKKQFLDFLNDPSFQGVNKLCVVSFENEDDRKALTKYIDGKNFFDEPIKYDLKTCD